MWRSAIIVVLVACHQTPAPAITQHVDDGITRCGPPVPPAPPASRSLPEREPVPSFVAPRADVGAGLSTDVISRAIIGHASRFRACFIELGERDTRAGSLRVTLNFQIVEDGSAAGIEVHGVDATMDRCICEEAERVRVAPFGRATVSFPLIFGNAL